MKDQVDAWSSEGLRATLLNSTLDPAEQYARLIEIEAGQYDLVYVAPERFRSPGSSRRWPGQAGAPGRRRGPLHQRVGPRLPARLRPDRPGPPPDRLAPLHRPDRHGDRPRPPRYRRPARPPRPCPVRHRVRPAQPELRRRRGPRDNDKLAALAETLGRRRPARPSSMPRAGRNASRSASSSKRTSAGRP